STFYECVTGDNGEDNIYIRALPGSDACSPITLHASSCAPKCIPPSPPPSCPANLNGPYEFPHLILNLDWTKPSTAPGTSYNGMVSPTVSSVFNFDIPQADSGKTCSLIFLFPTQSQLTTSSYTLTGNGAIDFCMLSGVANS